MSKIQIAVSILGIILLTGCSETLEVTIDHYRTPVPVWDGPWMSYVMGMPDGETLNWIWGIKGFSDYKWGTSYKLKVKRKYIANPPVDSPSVQYTLLEILSEEKADSEKLFIIPLKNLIYTYLIKTTNREFFTILNDIQITLDTDVSEKILFALLLSSDSVRGSFSHSPDGGIILHDFEGDFNRDIAIDSILRIFPDLEAEAVFEWEKDEFLSFININYSDSLWEELYL